jgi:hypothetical protein
MTRIFFLIYRSRFVFRYLIQRALFGVRNRKRFGDSADATTRPQSDTESSASTGHG